MAEAAAAAPEIRPLVPYLTLGETREQDYLNGSKCGNCGTMYVGPRLFCPKCSSDGPFESVRLSDHGEVYVYSVIHQATPYVKAPYIAAIVDLPEGVAVNTNIEGVEPDPKNIPFGMKVKMFTEKVSEDREGNSYIAYKFKPA
ncbi:MAG: Zn-ribbon domain-containing OB-fold protein [Dehalococcoidia bacterium]|nr:Zn-ribbon domain-containing OB-fold protein [Dehalococcoidia bacterium]